MPYSTRPCPTPGCSELVHGRQARCQAHQRQWEQRRGTKQQRGYGADHQQLRADWAPKVATGTIRCWRCDQLITAGQPWDLGHDDHDRTKHRGPEHIACNRATTGR